MNMNTVAPSAIASLPAVVEAANGVKVAVAEADIEDYPGLWLHGTAATDWRSLHTVSAQETMEKDRDLKYEAADYIAVTRGTRSYPSAAGNRRKGRRSDHEPTGLAAGQAITGTGHLMDQARQSCMPMVECAQRRRRRFQVQSQHSDLQILRRFRRQIRHPLHHPRRGMYKLGKLLEVSPELNIEELTAYAKQKNVGIILSIVWKTWMTSSIRLSTKNSRWEVRD